MTEEQKNAQRTYLEASKLSLSKNQDKMVAVVSAAQAIWQPRVDPTSIDETTPYLSDEEFDDIANLVEMLAEIATIRDLCRLFDLPDSMTDPILQERLRGHLVPSSMAKKNKVQAVVRKAARE